jgi:hypothetical protein
MKKIMLYFLAVQGLILLLSFGKADKTLTIQDAVKLKQAAAVVTSKGDYSGNCLTIQVTNTSKETVTITIPPGTVFHPVDEGDQDIFVVKQQVIVLKPSEKKVMDGNGFCCQLHDASPGEGEGFTVGITANEKLKKLADFLDKKDYPEHVVQEAVWCVSDDNEVTNIYAADPASVKPLREFICELTGQKDQWYTTEQKREVTPERVIVSEPVKVSGSLTYESTTGDQIRGELWGPDNKKLFDLGKPMTAQHSGTMSYGFNLKVTGFEKGKYTVIIYGNTKELLKQEFSI